MRHLILDAITECEDQTLRLGERFGAALRDRAVVGLIGTLGAGKTRLAQGIARGAGFDGRVRSPSFALLHIYRGRRLIRHIDLYRLDRLDDGTAGEWEEMFDTDGISLIEWADRIPELLPPEAIRVEIQIEGETRRRIRIAAPLPGRVLADWRIAR